MSPLPETIENCATLYDRIETYITANGYSPTVREVCRMLGTPSSAIGHRYLCIMRDQGWIDWKPNMARTITLKRSAAE